MSVSDTDTPSDQRVRVSEVLGSEQLVIPEPLLPTD
jgi:hypothetical protein